MRVKITGINGYIGTRLSELLRKKGHEVSGIERQLLYGSIDKLASEISSTEVIINLAGASILQRWTKTNRLKIYNSRVVTTRNLVQAIKTLSAENQPKIFISASAIGVYKPSELHDEKSTNFENGFLGKLVKDWENELSDLPSSLRLCIFRIGIVIGKEAETIKKLKFPYKLGLGGRISSGKQAFPFIHQQDLIEAIEWAITNNQIQGIFNLVAPEQVNNKQFTKTFARIINRPAFIPVPAFMLKLIFGKAATLLLHSPAIIPESLISQGYRFNYPTLYDTLNEVLT